MRSVSIGVLILTLLVGSAAIFALNGTSIDLSFLKAATSTALNSDKTPAEEKASAAQSVDAPIERATSELAALGDLVGDGVNADRAAGQDPSFDVVRIDPDGTSVFAGRAESSEQISIIAGDTPIGTAKADASGNWVLVTEKKIPDPNAKLKIVKGVVQPELPASDGARYAEPSAQPTMTYGGKASARDVNDRMIASLEQMIETARNQQAATASPAVEDAEPPVDRSSSTLPLDAQNSGDSLPSSAPSTATDTGEARSAQTSTRVADASASARQAQSSTQNGVGEQQVRGGAAQSIPIPIQFVYREATFTEQGRKAVSLLLEYLLVTKPRQVTLTGHADERGSPELNMKLSQERLQAVSDYVRSGGYSGALTMTPKGETDPYRGVDRSKYAREELYTLDRRVELRLDG